MRRHFCVEEHGPKHLRNSYLSKVILEAFQLHYTVHQVVLEIRKLQLQSEHTDIRKSHCCWFIQSGMTYSLEQAIFIYLFVLSLVKECVWECVSLFGATALRCNLRDVRHPTWLEFRVEGSYGAAIVSPTNSNNNINIIHRANNCRSITLPFKLGREIGKAVKPRLDCKPRPLQADSCGNVTYGKAKH